MWGRLGVLLAAESGLGSPALPMCNTSTLIPMLLLPHACLPLLPGWHLVHGQEERGACRQGELLRAAHRQLAQGGQGVVGGWDRLAAAVHVQHAVPPLTFSH